LVQKKTAQLRAAAEAVAFVGPESGGSVQSSLLRMHHPLLIAAIVVGVIFVALAVHVLRFLAKPEDFR
jgi:hypothetical protein